MMATTHGLVGLLVGAAVGVVAPDLAVPALVAGGIGGLAPDLDLYAGHRRTLHFPVYSWVAAAPSAGIAVLAPGPLTVGLAVFLVAAALHASTDVLGGGLELRPWLETSERAVYDHFRGQWLSPRRLVRYDGAPEDLLLGVGVGAVTLGVATAGNGAGGLVTPLVGALLGVSAVYAGVRRRIPTITEWVVGLVPPGLRRHLPERFLKA